MDRSQFLDKFLNQVENEIPDVFQELENIRNSNLPRRFSFSIPDDQNISDFSEFTAPPSSPELNPMDLKHNLAIQIPNDFSLNNFNDDDDDNDSLPFTPRNIQESISFPVENLLTTSKTDTTLYKMPPRKSYDARKIWKHARIPSVANIRHIESNLLDWAFSHASLEIVGKSIKSITWRSNSGCICYSNWNAFIRWMICATVSC